MKFKNSGSLRMRVIAAVCAMIVIAGSGAGVYVLRNNPDAKAVNDEKAAASSTVSSRESDIISAGGTITSSQLSDSLGLKNTAVQLKVGAVLVEAGDTVTAGTPLYQITSDSLAKAEKTLRSELQTAKSALLKQKMSYQTDKNEAYLLYESELLLGDTAQKEYESGMSSLDSDLKKAYDSYQEALNTVNDTPSEISAKQRELDSQQAYADELQDEKNAIQDEVNNAKAAYDSAAEYYNSITAEYNAAAGVVRYLGNALGKDTSDIELAQKKTPELKGQNTFSADKDDNRSEINFDTGGEPQSFAMSGIKLDTYRASLFSDDDTGSGDNNADDALSTLYGAACEEYNAVKEKLIQAESDMNNTESEYRTLSDSLTECSSRLKEAQNNVTSVSKEISTLESTLSKAKSNLSKLRSEYNSLNASYRTDQIELKNKLDTDTVAYENAEYHYQITCSTIEDELAEVQEAYDTAEENLKIFEESLADGYIRAAQDGTIYTLNCQEGRSVNINMPYVYYVDESGYFTTVELDQNDITQVSIGDTVVIYSSETGMANGKITAIAAGESTSLADVRFNVTVTADENADLYNGESVNVYFNYEKMKSSDFSDFKGGMSSDGEKRSFDGERPDFGGGMPEGFDPSNMSDFSIRKED